MSCRHSARPDVNPRSGDVIQDLARSSLRTALDAPDPPSVGTHCVGIFHANRSAMESPLRRSGYMSDLTSSAAETLYEEPTGGGTDSVLDANPKH